MQSNDVHGLTANFAKAGLVAGTTSTYTTTVAVGGCVGGVFITALAVKTNVATPTTDTVTGSAFTALAANQGCVFVFSVTTAGAIGVSQGSIETLDGGTFNVAPSFPAVDLGSVLPIGYMVVKNGATGSAWTFGTTAWAATGCTNTTTDVSTMPTRPVII